MNFLNNIRYFFEDLYWDAKFFIENKLEEHKWNKTLSEEDAPFVGEYNDHEISASWNDEEVEEKPKKKKSKKKTSKKSKKTL
jgi:hypothetical protein